MKIMVCGNSRAGKDTFCRALGMKWASSSRTALRHVIWPNMSNRYSYMEACFGDRINQRNEWYRLIEEFNREDPTKLMRIVFRESDVYCGIRNRREFMAGKRLGLFDLAIWIYNPNVEKQPTDGVMMDDCDIIVRNDGSLDSLTAKAKRLAGVIATDGREDVKNLIVGWADNVFPNRTITNALTKLVMEEIPEYLRAQDDPMEMADLGILIYDIAHLAGVDLDAAIRAKMEINKRRLWAVSGKTGLMSHIKDYTNGND